MVGHHKIIATAVGRHVRDTFSAGLLVLIPLGVTVLIFKVLLDWFDPLVKPLFETFLGEGQYVTGMGVGALVIIVYIVGLFTTHVLGRRLIELAHRIIGVIPIVRSIYNTMLQFTEVLSNTNTTDPAMKYSGVVLVDFPTQGSKAVGLITSRVLDTKGNPAVAVYVPTTPIPTSGFLLIVKEEDVIYTDVTVDEAMKLVITGGLITPEDILLPRGVQSSDNRASNH